MDYLQIAATSLISIIVLFLLAKLIGNRQLSELSVFDYINGISIGSIAAEMATDLEKHWTKTLLAMLIYGLATAFISYLCCKSLSMRRIFNGRAIILYDDGKFSVDGLKRARLDVNEFLTQCRVAGYFDLSQVKTAIMEQNGKISFLPKSQNRPLTPSDMALNVPEENISVTAIIDGKVLEENLVKIGFDKKWILKQASLAVEGRLENVMIATVDKSGNATFFTKVKKSSQNDIFM